LQASPPKVSDVTSAAISSKRLIFRMSQNLPESDSATAAGLEFF